MSILPWDQLDRAALRAFGRDVTYAPSGSPPYPLRAILDAGARPEESAPGVYAVIFARAADFALPPVRGDEVTVGSSTYKVVDIDADAEGGIRLVLHFSRSV